MKLFVAIPALNEEKTIANVIENIPESMPGISDVSIMVIDDGSKDLTAEKAKKAGATVISHEKTKGLGKVFVRAAHEALSQNADIMVMIDGDGQFDANDIPHVALPITQGKADIVTCSRFRNKSFIPKDMPPLKRFGNRFLARALSGITKHGLTDATCGFRAYSREALLNLNLFDKFTYTQEVLLQLLFKDFRLQEVPLRVKGKREFGNSQISGNLFNYAFRVFFIIFRVIRDYHPLRYIGGFGVLLFLIGLGIDVFVFRHYLAEGAFTPYKWLAFFGGFLNVIGFLIFFLGITADMTNRIRMTQEKSLYFEKKNYYDDDRRKK